MGIIHPLHFQACEIIMKDILLKPESLYTMAYCTTLYGSYTLIVTGSENRQKEGMT